MGTVVKTYAGYNNVKLIDSGGFGNVYKYSNQRAVKEEFKVIIYCVRIYIQCINLLMAGYLSGH